MMIEIADPAQAPGPSFQQLVKREMPCPYYFAALALKKNDPENSGVIFHQGLVVSCRLDAFERPGDRLAKLPVA